MSEAMSAATPGAIHLRREGEHVAVLEIDKPPRNTLGRAMRALLREHLSALQADLTVRALVITGRGKAFCSGDDLREELEAVSGGGQAGANLADFGSLLDQLESFRAPVIAAIGGWCVGGGVELALCCDLRLASTEAKFVCAGVNVGLMASAWRLPRLIGVANAKQMLFTGEAFDSAAAARFGLVSEVTEPERLMEAALKLAQRISRARRCRSRPASESRARPPAWTRRRRSSCRRASCRRCCRARITLPP